MESWHELLDLLGPNTNTEGVRRATDDIERLGRDPSTLRALLPYLEEETNTRYLMYGAMLLRKVVDRCWSRVRGTEGEEEVKRVLLGLLLGAKNVATRNECLDAVDTILLNATDEGWAGFWGFVEEALESGRTELGFTCMQVAVIHTPVSQFKGLLAGAAEGILQCLGSCVADEFEAGVFAFTGILSRLESPVGGRLGEVYEVMMRLLCENAGEESEIANILFEAYSRMSEMLRVIDAGDYFRRGMEIARSRKTNAGHYEKLFGGLCKAIFKCGGLRPHLGDLLVLAIQCTAVMWKNDESNTDACLMQFEEVLGKVNGAEVLINACKVVKQEDVSTVFGILTAFDDFMEFSPEIAPDLFAEKVESVLRVAEMHIPRGVWETSLRILRRFVQEVQYGIGEELDRIIDEGIGAVNSDQLSVAKEGLGLIGSVCEVFDIAGEVADRIFECLGGFIKANVADASSEGLDDVIVALYEFANSLGEDMYPYLQYLAQIMTTVATVNEKEHPTMKAYAIETFSLMVVHCLEAVQGSIQSILQLFFSVTEDSDFEVLRASFKAIRLLGTLRVEGIEELMRKGYEMGVGFLQTDLDFMPEEEMGEDREEQEARRKEEALYASVVGECVLLLNNIVKHHQEIVGDRWEEVMELVRRHENIMNSETVVPIIRIVANLIIGFHLDGSVFTDKKEEFDAFEEETVSQLFRTAVKLMRKGVRLEDEFVRYGFRSALKAFRRKLDAQEDEEGLEEEDEEGGSSTIVSVMHWGMEYLREMVMEGSVLFEMEPFMRTVEFLVKKKDFYALGYVCGVIESLLYHEIGEVDRGRLIRVSVECFFRVDGCIPPFPVSCMRVLFDTAVNEMGVGVEEVMEHIRELQSEERRVKPLYKVTQLHLVLLVLSVARHVEVEKEVVYEALRIHPVPNDGQTGRTLRELVGIEMEEMMEGLVLRYAIECLALKSDAFRRLHLGREEMEFIRGFIKRAEENGQSTDEIARETLFRDIEIDRFKARLTPTTIQ